MLVGSTEGRTKSVGIAVMNRVVYRLRWELYRSSAKYPTASGNGTPLRLLLPPFKHKAPSSFPTAPVSIPTLALDSDVSIERKREKKR